MVLIALVYMPQKIDIKSFWGAYNNGYGLSLHKEQCHKIWESAFLEILKIPLSEKLFLVAKVNIQRGEEGSL